MRPTWRCSTATRPLRAMWAARPPAGAGMAAAQSRAHHPIPGTTSVAHLLDDLGAVDVRLDAATMRAAGRADQRAHGGGQPLQRAERE